MGFVVKNTTKVGLIDLICPHSCRGCGLLGAPLCECCKNNILSPPSTICPICGLEVANADKLCHKCQLLSTTPLDALWFVGNRDHLLKQLISEYKYHSVRALGPILADLLHHSIPPDLPELTIVPLPTIGKHVRARGFDHTLQIAKHLAKIRGWRVQPLLARAKDTVQVGAKAQQREAQASTAYVLAHTPSPNISQTVNPDIARTVHPNITHTVNPDIAHAVDSDTTHILSPTATSTSSAKALDSNTIYLLLDDVWTTGASMLSAAKLLRQALPNATIYAAVIGVSV